MVQYLRDTAVGQLIRFITRHKVLRYQEEDPNFKIPWEEAQVSAKVAEVEAHTPVPDGDSSVDHTPQPTPLDPEKEDPVGSRDHVREGGLSTIPTQASSAARQLGPVTTRTTTREQTRQYTRERFDIEQHEAADRQQSSIIVPQKTADGITLVD
ncbi:MAG: hypothetical protein M1823_008515, partial [Watsoniomyces obsoletus]